MARFNINCDDVWKEVSDAEFVNLPSGNEFDFDSVRRTAELIREAWEVLQGPAPLSPRQKGELKSKVQILEAQLAKESVVAKRVDSRMSVYARGSKQPGTNKRRKAQDKGLQWNVYKDSMSGRNKVV